MIMLRPANRRDGQRGSVLVLVAVMLVALTALAALVIDLGVLYVAAEQAQQAADSAALAGVGKLREGMSPTAASAEAITAAAKNSVLGTPVTLASSDVVVGAWDSAAKQVIAWDPTATQVAVQATVRRTTSAPNGAVPTFFARVFGVSSMNVTRTSVAGLYVEQRPRNAVSLMVVQDGSGSFSGAWNQAISADTGLLNLINGVAKTNDGAGLVTFNAALDQSTLHGTTYNVRVNGRSYTCNLWDTNTTAGCVGYDQHPEANQGIKYTTNTSGAPVLTDSTGSPSSSGSVQPMTGPLTVFGTAHSSSLPAALNTASQLLNNGNAWGDTDTAAGLNYAIDKLQAGAASGSDQVIVLVSDGMPHSVLGTSATNDLKNAATAAANRAGNLGIKIYTVTLEGSDGVNYAFNESLIRNGGYAFRAADSTELFDKLIAVGAVVFGRPTIVK
jgi:Flp pilus assembly protein TadG